MAFFLIDMALVIEVGRAVSVPLRLSLLCDSLSRSACVEVVCSTALCISVLAMDLPNLKVKLRCTGLNATRHSIIRMLDEHAISCSKVLRINENLLILFCNSLRDIDRIFCDDLCDEFGKLDCEPIPPPDLQAKRSFIVKSVDPVIYGEEVEEIAAELGNKNPWLVVKSVYRFNKSKTLKVTCSNQEMVNII